MDIYRSKCYCLLQAFLKEHVWRKKTGISDTHEELIEIHGEVQLWSGQVQLRSIELDVGPPMDRDNKTQTLKEGCEKGPEWWDSFVNSGL